MQSNQRIQILLEVALFAVIALILDLFIPTFGPVKIDIKMLPIVIIALRRGFVPGILSGLLWGLLQVLVGDAYILTISQFLLEYFVAFALIGFAGMASKPLQKLLHEEPEALGKQTLWASIGLIVGSGARYIIHFLAGYIFWGAYAPEGQGALLYSFIVNGTAFLTETGTVLIALILLAKYFQRLLRVENYVISNSLS